MKGWHGNDGSQFAALVEYDTVVTGKIRIGRQSRIMKRLSRSIHVAKPFRDVGHCAGNDRVPYGRICATPSLPSHPSGRLELPLASCMRATASGQGER